MHALMVQPPLQIMYPFEKGESLAKVVVLAKLVVFTGCMWAEGFVPQLEGRAD